MPHQLDVSRARLDSDEELGAMTAALPDRLRELASDLDEVWRDALAREDFDLISCSGDASHGVHRALVAFEAMADGVADTAISHDSRLSSRGEPS